MKKLRCSLIVILSFIATYETAYGQLCGGSLSDPIISIDFGSQGATGTNYGSPLSTTETSYLYVANNNMGDGQYTITSNSYNGRPQWHNSPDHTAGDTNGNMLLVNADYTPGEFYRKRVSGLCEYTNFEFSAWILNALPPGICNPTIRPDVKFEIRTTAGQLLASVTTGSLAESSSPSWQKFGVSFDSGLNSVVDVILINNAPGGCGNDLAIDDIEFRACGDEAKIDANIDYTSICPNAVPASIQLDANIDGSIYTTPVYQWQVSTDGSNWNDLPGEINPYYVISPVISNLYYRYLLANTPSNLLNENCRVTSQIVPIVIKPDPNYMIAGETKICENETLTLQVQGNNAIQQLTWTLPDNSQVTSNPLVISNAPPAGNYRLEIIDEYGCTYNRSIAVEILETSAISVFIEDCEGSTYTIGDNENYVLSTSESFQRLVQKRSNGCDSLISYDVRVWPKFNQSLDTIVCYGDTIRGADGNIINLYTDTLINYQFQSLFGCDSLVAKNITVPQEVNISQVVCENDVVVLPNNDEVVAVSSFNRQFIFPSTTTSCDSIVNFSLTVHPNYVFDSLITACPYIAFYLPNGVLVRDEGTYTETFPTKDGCDSIFNYIVQFEVDSCTYNDICVINFPNAIGVNNNGYNESFKALSAPICNYENYELTIFNRWGEKLFSSRSPLDEWVPENSQQNAFFLWSVHYDLKLEDGSIKTYRNSGVVNNVK